MENQTLIKLLEDLKNNGFIYNDSDLCRKLGCSKSFLSEMKAGKRTITQQFVTRLHEAFPEFFNPKEVQIKKDEPTLGEMYRALVDHDIRFHETANRILDKLGETKETKDKTA